jgi:hypothetical protein
MHIDYVETQSITPEHIEVKEQRNSRSKKSSLLEATLSA